MSARRNAVSGEPASRDPHDSWHRVAARARAPTAGSQVAPTLVEARD